MDPAIWRTEATRCMERAHRRDRDQLGISGQFQPVRRIRCFVPIVTPAHRELEGVERDGHVFDVNLRQNGRNLDWSFGAFEISPDFDTEVGFVRRTDQRRTTGNVSRRWFPQNWIIDWSPRFSYGRNWNFDGVLDDETAGLNVSVSLAKNLRASTSIDRDMERFGGIDFAPNRYRFGGGVNNRSFSITANRNGGDPIVLTARILTWARVGF